MNYTLKDALVYLSLDSTNVDANVNYPKRKRLIEQSFFKVIKETEKYNKELALKCKDEFNLETEK